mgnify:FL=1|jgi:hypothetical protein
MSDQEQPKMDAANLYREELFTDRTVGTIRSMIPVTPNGEADPARATVYQGAAQMMTPAGALPLNFEIDAKDLSEACEKFAECAAEAMEETFKELQEMRRQQASSIVVPGQGGAPGGGIQIP